MTVIFDLSDVQFNVRGLSITSDTDVGYAYLPESEEPILGIEARESARLHPTRINNRFWGDLNTEPAKPAHPKVRHNADLAWYHLKKFSSGCADTPIVFACPSTYSEQTLQLLAGVANSLDMNLSTFINRAIASTLPLANRLADSDKKFVHAEIQQQQLVLSYLKIENDKLVLDHYERFPAQGLLRVQEKWLHILRHRFIESSRFDPMHTGESEQQLFDQLQNYASTDSGSYKFSIDHGDETLVDEVSADILAQPVEQLLEEIRGRAKGQVLCLHDVLGKLPSVELQADEHCWSSTDLFAGVEQILAHHQHSEAAPSVIHSAVVTYAAKPDAVAVEKTANAESAVPAATHILIDGYAYPADDYVIDASNGMLKLERAKTKADAHFVIEGNAFKCTPRIAAFSSVSDDLAGAELAVGDQISIDDQHRPILAIAIAAQD